MTFNPWVQGSSPWRPTIPLSAFRLSGGSSAGVLETSNGAECVHIQIPVIDRSAVELERGPDHRRVFDSCSWLAKHSSGHEGQYTRSGR
jgi:hypothetical protein